MTPTTLQSIADHLGLSRNTVSCALRNRGRIAESTRERVRKAAEELGYRPNPLVSALMQLRRSGQTPASISNLAFLHNYQTQEYWRQFPHCVEMFTGAERRATELGFNLTPVWANPQGSADSLTKILLNRGVVGIVLPPVFGFCPPPTLDWSHFAATAIGHTLKEPRLHIVGTLFLNLIPIAVAGLKSLGYRRIGILISPKSNVRVDFGWEAGYAIAKREATASGIALHMLRAKMLKIAKLRSWIEKYQLQAIVVAGTNFVKDQLFTLGMRIPQDIGLVDILDEKGEVASVRREHEAIGRIAVETTVNQLLHNERGIPQMRHLTLLDGVWNPRDTVQRVGE